MSKEREPTLETGPNNVKDRSRKGLVVSLQDRGEEIAIFLDDAEQIANTGQYGCSQWQGVYFFTSFRMSKESLHDLDLSEADLARIGRAVLLGLELDK